MIRVRDLVFGYRSGGFRLSVEELTVDEGASVALSGPSGCGKTTLIHLLAGILEAEAGSIEVAGLDMAALSPEDRQDLRILKVGLVFQEFELLEYLDVLDNVLLPYRLTPILEADEHTRERASKLLHDVGLGDKLHRYPGKLSQGERQRVAVCRALVTRPAVVLGDEPTGNLDPDNRDHVIDTLLEYGRKTEAPVVIVTHDHDLLPRFDRVVLVSGFAPQGRTREDCPQITQMDAGEELEL